LVQTSMWEVGLHRTMFPVFEYWVRNYSRIAIAPKLCKWGSFDPSYHLTRQRSQI
jgi:hypothetical protein